MPPQESKQLKALLASDPQAAAQVIESIRSRMLVPHEKQKAIIESTARFRIIRAGRRFGKTKISAREIVKNAITQPGSMNWWVSNRWKNTRRGYRNVVKMIPPELLQKPPPADTSPELILRFKNGSIIEFYSGESPDSLAGEGVDFIVVDEAALIRDHVWHQLIRPTLMDSGGRALIISTPRGKNWFWEIWHRGDDPNEADYESWHFSSYDNPFLVQADIAEAKRTLPTIIYQQEIEAEFVANAASIFVIPETGIRDLVAPRGHIFVGLDLAKKSDFTVITASREGDRLPVYHDRFNEISWPMQRGRILQAVRWLEEHPDVTGVTVLVDVGGPGDVVYDDLELEGIDVVAINFTNWKEKAVRLLSADLERGQAFILPEQQAEFSSYEYEITKAGRFKFEAATGHDDEVSAKLLEHWGQVHRGSPNIRMVTGVAGNAAEQASMTDMVTPMDAAPASPQELMNNPEVWSRF